LVPQFGYEFHLFWPNLVPLGSIELAVLENVKGSEGESGPGIHKGRNSSVTVGILVLLVSEIIPSAESCRTQC
jgi:hypothetical protein